MWQCAALAAAVYRRSAVCRTSPCVYSLPSHTTTFMRWVPGGEYAASAMNSRLWSVTHTLQNSTPPSTTVGSAPLPQYSLLSSVQATLVTHAAHMHIACAIHHIKLGQKPQIVVLGYSKLSSYHNYFAFGHPYMYIHNLGWAEEAHTLHGLHS